jgi:hypothetical protein
MQHRFLPLWIALAIAPGGCALLADEEGLLGSTEVVRTHATRDGEIVEVASFSRRGAGEPLPEHWQPYMVLPSKPRTEYRLVETEEGIALEAEAERAASGLYRKIRIDPHRHPHLEWRWRVPRLIDGADPRLASREDSPVRLLVSFHGDPAKIDMEERAKMRLIKALSGQAMPYATLVYIWSNQVPAETVVPNPHTDRVRMIVVESGAQRVGRWIRLRRNVLEDFRRAFGEEPWDIVAVGVMTDSDNTASHARGHYGDIAFRRDPYARREVCCAPPAP